MATESEIVQQTNKYMRASGYTCGRSYSDVGDVASQIQGQLSGETKFSLEQKLRQIVSSGSYGFKSSGDKISASDPGNPDCGRT